MLDTLLKYAFRIRDVACNMKIIGIDKKDGMVDLCEMKYSNGVLIDKEYEIEILNKVENFRSSTKIRKAIKVTLVTLYDILGNKMAV